jgi:hypothetical protein
MASMPNLQQFLLANLLVVVVAIVAVAAVFVVVVVVVIVVVVLPVVVHFCLPYDALLPALRCTSAAWLAGPLGPLRPLLLHHAAQSLAIWACLSSWDYGLSLFLAFGLRVSECSEHR